MTKLVLEKQSICPNNWKVVNFDDIILSLTDHHSNGSFQTIRENVVTFKEKNYAVLVRLVDLRKNMTDSKSFRYTDKHGYEFLKKSHLHGGEILVGKIGSIGTSQIMPKMNVPCVLAPNMLQVSLSPLIVKKYFNYFLQSASYWNEINKINESTTQPKINKKQFYNIQIPISPLNEQKKIVKKIEELFSKLDNIKMILDDVRCQINQYRESLLKSAFDGSLTKHWRKNNENSLLKKELIIKMISEVRESQKKLKFNEISPPIPKYLEHIPDSWMHVYLDSLLIDARYGTSEKCFVEKNDVCVIRIPNILSGKLDFSNLKYTNSKNNSFEKLFLVKNDILVCRTNGSLDLVGRSAIVEEIENNFAYASYLIRLRIENKILNSAYLNFLINSIVIRNFITRETRTTAGQFNVNLDMLRSIEIPVCGLGEQEEIVSKLEDGFLLIENSEKNLNILFSKLDILRSTILKSAFEGELVPQDPNDEPAEVLLQKIKQEKEQLKQKQKASRSKKNVK